MNPPKKLRHFRAMNTNGYPKMPSVMFPLSKAVVGFVRTVAIFCESFSAPLLSDVVNARKIV